MSRLINRLRRPLLAASAAALVLTTTAVAGSGVGGTFNLGQTNTVNAKSVLTGNTTAAQLAISNTSTDPSATALSLSVTGGKPPFKTSSTVKVANLNADLLDGRDSTYFLPATGTAVNSNQLGGLLPTAFWKLGGNSAASTGILGTTTNQALDLRVNDQRALRLEPNATSPNLIGGFSGNGDPTGSGSFGTAIGGGGNSSFPNYAADNYDTVGGGVANLAGTLTPDPTTASGATVGGGEHNAATGFDSVISGGDSNSATGVKAAIGGGQQNQATASVATVGGGDSNTASANEATVAGGLGNTASVDGATVGGGFSNQASAFNATVPGGAENLASGQHSLAAGSKAQAQGNGSFVWSDSASFKLGTTTDDVFVVHALNGIYFGQQTLAADTTVAPAANRFIDTSTNGYLSTGGVWTDSSDRALKHDFRPLDQRTVLEKVARMPITSWSYKAEQPSIRHIGPMAQDFYAAFGLGLDDKHIATIDEGGVALAAIQGLYRENQALQRQNRSLNARLSRLERQMGALTKRGR